MRLCFLLFICFICGFACDPTASEKYTAESEYRQNQQKWQAYKSTITSYRIEEYFSGAFWSWNLTLVIDTATDSVTYCQLKLRMGGNPASETTTDCIGDSTYSKTMEDYFTEAAGYIADGTIQNLKFDSATGAPLSAYGASPDPMIQDASTPGFTITVK